MLGKLKLAKNSGWILLQFFSLECHIRPKKKAVPTPFLKWILGNKLVQKN